MTQWHLSSIDLMAHMLGARNKFADYYSTKLFLAKPRHGNHFSEMYRYSYDSSAEGVTVIPTGGVGQQDHSRKIVADKAE